MAAPREPVHWSSNDIDTPSNTRMVITTDVRSPKVQQIATSPFVSLSWWMPPTMTQFRIRAKAFIFSPPKHSELLPFPARQLEPAAGFDWEQERLRHWRKLTPELRASFLRPTPGSFLAEDPTDWPEVLPHDLEASEHEELIRLALSRFALIILDPHEVDICELARQPHSRTIYKLADGVWDARRVVP
ncbi:hypothetical protein OIV83_005363 [Microbotryomycetes sp. JL201]|nr:hypothetical protein OIV83_005363 [Microbotryomycetes sp. JL201]